MHQTVFPGWTGHVNYNYSMFEVPRECSSCNRIWSRGPRYSNYEKVSSVGSAAEELLFHDQEPCRSNADCRKQVHSFTTLIRANAMITDEFLWDAGTMMCRKILLNNGIEQLIRRAKQTHNNCKAAATDALRDLGLDNYNLWASLLIFPHHISYYCFVLATAQEFHLL